MTLAPLCIRIKLPRTGEVSVSVTLYIKPSRILEAYADHHPRLGKENMATKFRNTIETFYFLNDLRFSETPLDI